MRTRATILCTALLLGACSTTTPTDSTSAIEDLDPERLYLDYESDDGDFASGGAALPTATEDSADDGLFEPEPPPVPGIDEDNQFADVGDSPWIRAAEDALSTFGLDVDTGSYTVLRRFVDEGFIPPAEAIRIEEFVNALEPADPTPTEGDLGVVVEAGPNPLDTESLLVRIGVRGRTIDAAARPDANLTVVIDTSGSMDIRDRLGLVKASLAVLAQNLRDTDQLAIVIFSDDAAVHLEPTAVADDEAIADAIESLSATSSTNLEAGLRRGYQLAAEMYTEGEINRVILAGDGVANVGETGPGSLVELIAQDASRGIRLVTVGFGLGNYNDELMEQLADQGDGFYAYVDDLDEARRLFETELLSTLVTVADEARIQVAFDPAVVDEYRLVGYENRAIADDAFRDDSTDAGEVGAGHDVTALYEVRLVDGAVGDLGTVSLRWVSAESGEVIETDATLTPGDAVSAHAELARLVARFAEIAGERPGTSSDDLPELADALDAAADAVDSAVGRDMARLARELADLVGADQQQ